MRNLILVLILTLALASSALAYAPNTLTFQGRLADAGGSSLPDGNYSVTVRMYTQAGGGAPIWSSTEQVTLSGGVFSVLLGETTPLTLSFDQVYFVGVQYEAEPEMTPRVPLSSTPYALGVSEDAAVTSLNGLTGDFNLVGGSNVNIGVVGGNLVISANGAVADNDWNVVDNDMHSAPIGNVGLGTTTPESKLQAIGNITAGDNTNAGQFRSYNSGGVAARFGGDFFGEGSGITLYQENGSSFMNMEPDFDGVGGYFQITNGFGGAAFRVDGNNGGNPVITFQGTNSMYFDLGESGNGSVVLPADAIGAAEIFDETGIASITGNGGSAYVLTTSYSTISSRTITVPADGYLLATSSCEIELNHQGVGCYTTVGLSTTGTTVPGNQDLSYYLPGAAAQGQYLNPSSPSAVFPVTAGAHTIYLVGKMTGTTDSVVWDTQINLLFVPTSYGTVALASGIDDGRQDENTRISPAITAGDLSQERARSGQDNDQRMADELATLRAQLEALEARVNTQQAQDDNGLNR